jgi:hypothetical protein
MHNADDELCLKYVLNELDPSEVLLVERAMAKDDDTLIEVESLRLTLRKIDRIPEYKPPKHVQQRILEEAKRHAEERYQQSRIINFFSIQNKMSYTAAAVAAVLLISISYGMYQYSVEYQTDLNSAGAALESFGPANITQTDAPDIDFSTSNTRTASSERTVFSAGSAGMLQPSFNNSYSPKLNYTRTSGGLGQFRTAGNFGGGSFSTGSHQSFIPLHFGSSSLSNSLNRPNMRNINGYSIK